MGAAAPESWLWSSEPIIISGRKLGDESTSSRPSQPPKVSQSEQRQHSQNKLNGENGDSTNEITEMPEDGAFSDLLLRIILAVDPSCLETFLRTLDTDALGTLVPMFLRPSLNAASNIGTGSHDMPDHRQLIALLKDKPAALVAAIDGLFFPGEETSMSQKGPCALQRGNEPASSGSPCLNMYHLSSQFPTTEVGFDPHRCQISTCQPDTYYQRGLSADMTAREVGCFLKNVGQAGLFAKLNAVSPLFGPRLVCETRFNDGDLLIGAITCIEDASFHERLWELFKYQSKHQSPEAKVVETYDNAAVSSIPPGVNCAKDDESNLASKSPLVSALTKEFGNRITYAHDTLTLLQATEDAEHTLILAPIRRQAAIIIQAAVRASIQTKLHLCSCSTGTQTDSSQPRTPYNIDIPGSMATLNPFDATRDDIHALRLRASAYGFDRNTGIEEYIAKLGTQIDWTTWRSRALNLGFGDNIDAFLTMHASCVEWDSLRYLAHHAGCEDNVEKFLEDKGATRFVHSKVSAKVSLPDTLQNAEFSEVDAQKSDWAASNVAESSPICKMYAIASANIGTGSDSQFDSSKDKSELLETDIVLQCPGRGNDARSTTTITANLSPCDILNSTARPSLDNRASLHQRTYIDGLCGPTDAPDLFFSRSEIDAGASSRPSTQTQALRLESGTFSHRSPDGNPRSGTSVSILESTGGDSISELFVPWADFLCPQCSWSERTSASQAQGMRDESTILGIAKSTDARVASTSLIGTVEEHAPPEMSMYKGPPLLDFEKRMISTPSQPQVDVEFSPYLKLLVGKVAASTLSNVTPLSLEASLLRINRILADKATLDAAVARDGHVPQSLPGYISSWHVMRFGQRDAARQHEIRLRARVFAFLGSYRRMTTCHDSTNETLDAFARRRMRQFCDLLGVSPVRAPLYSPLVQHQFIILLWRLFPGDPRSTADALLPAQLRRRENTGSAFQSRQTDVVPLSRVVCALIGSGLNVDVDEPVTWDAPYLLQVASEMQLKQLLKKARALPQVSRRDTSGALLGRGIAVNDILDLALNFMFDRAKEIQGRLRASLKSFNPNGDECFSWFEFSSLLKSLDAKPNLSFEDTVQLFEEVQGDTPTVADQASNKESNTESECAFIDSVRFARGAWKSGVFKHVNKTKRHNPASTMALQAGIRNCRALCTVSMDHQPDISVAVKLESSSKCLAGSAPNAKLKNARRTVVADAIKRQGGTSCVSFQQSSGYKNFGLKSASKSLKSHPSGCKVTHHSPSRGVVFARLKHKQFASSAVPAATGSSFQVEVLQNRAARKIY